MFQTSEIKTYYILNGISPKLRTILSILLFVVGYLLQISSKNILIGLPFIIGCVVINLIRNFSLKPVRPIKLNWKEVTIERINQVEAHCHRLKKIQGNKLGCVLYIVFFFVIIFFVMPIISSLIETGEQRFFIFVVLLNTFLVFGGLVLSGNRSVWIPNNLDVKIPVIKRIINNQIITKNPSLKAIPYLEIGETKEGTFPNDTRILIKLKDAPEDFFGIQLQVSINNVQGTTYPYLYGVFIAKPSFGLFKKIGKFSLRNITIEKERSEGMDVVVIRQTTTKRTGYYTDPRVQDYILYNCIEIAKKIF